MKKLKTLDKTMEKKMMLQMHSYFEQLRASGSSFPSSPPQPPTNSSSSCLDNDEEGIFDTN